MQDEGLVNVVQNVQLILISPEVQVMIPRYEYLVTVWELNEPVQKIQYLILRPVFRDVSAMNKHITFREILQMVVLAVGVGVLAKLVIMVHMVSGLIIRNG